MSAFTFKPVACRIPPEIGASSPNPKVSKVKMMSKQSPPPLQVKGKENGQESLTMTSRREIMEVAAAASIGILSFLLPTPAEARPKNTTMRQKIMEKFEKLREKAGLSEPKAEGDEKSKVKDDEKETKPKPKNGSEEKKAQNQNGDRSSGPTLPNIINGTKTTVEPILP